jgi:hypothetical protein
MLATVEAGKYDVCSKPEIANILNLVRSIFEAPIALIAMYGDKKVYMRYAVGIDKISLPFDVSTCAWHLSSEHPTTLVVEDFDRDDRYARILTPHVVRSRMIAFGLIPAP